MAKHDDDFDEKAVLEDWGWDSGAVEGKKRGRPRSPTGPRRRTSINTARWRAKHPEKHRASIERFRWRKVWKREVFDKLDLEEWQYRVALQEQGLDQRSHWRSKWDDFRAVYERFKGEGCKFCGTMDIASGLVDEEPMPILDSNQQLRGFACQLCQNLTLDHVCDASRIPQPREPKKYDLFWEA